MIPLAIAAIIGLAVLVSTTKWCIDEVFYDSVGFGIVFETMFLILTAAVALGAWAGVNGIANLAVDHDDHYRTVELAALRDGTGQAGQYVWGTGTTSASANYVFYYLDDGAKRLVNIDSTDVRLYEDSDKPYAIQYTGCDLTPSWVGECFDNGLRFVEIHVPAGSVRNQVDLALNDK